MPVLPEKFDKNPRFLIGAAIVALLVFGAGGFLFMQNKTKAQQAAAAQAAAQPQAVPVKVQAVQRQPVKIWTSFSGRMVAVDFAEIRPQVSGRIDAVGFYEGQHVDQGDVLFVIDPRPYEAAVVQAQADVVAAQNDERFAASELKRSKGLIEKKAIAQSVYDGRVNAARVASAALKAAEARLEQAKIDLDYAHVKAPISGRVSRAEITQGNVVTAGVNAPLLTSVVSQDGIYADFDVDEQTYLRYVRAVAKDVAQEHAIPVRLFAGNAGTVQVDGVIRSFDNRIDPDTGTIRARAFFDNRDGVLLPGMFARVQIGSGDTRTEIMLPDTAIGTNQDRKFVYIAGKDNQVEYRDVTLGESLDGQRVIASGLKDGDAVILDGLMRLRPGAKIAPQLIQ